MSRVLVVTEKRDPGTGQWDGGARLVQSLCAGLDGCADILQFDWGGGERSPREGVTRFRYPHDHACRFQRRILNASFIAERVAQVSQQRAYSQIVFVHVSMQFGVPNEPDGAVQWTFPMFLTPSYTASGEEVPAAYTALERQTMARTDRILTPSHLEKMQLIEFFGVEHRRIHVVPRGVDRTLLTPQIRSRPDDRGLVFASVGSIKPQKNTIGVVELFSDLLETFPGSRLRLIGPRQDAGYARRVDHRVQALGLTRAVDAVGFVPPAGLSDALADASIHLSASRCETFGREIFETMALGIPGIAQACNNAAHAFLSGQAGVRFVDHLAHAHEAVVGTVGDLEVRSRAALGVGELFDDDLLRDLMAAEVTASAVMAVCDFDGTLFHKDDPPRTRQALTAFARFPMRVVCSARPIPDLLATLRRLGIHAHYLVGWGGAVLADERGVPLRIWPLPSDIAGLGSGTVFSGVTVQATSHTIESAPPGTRLETYGGAVYVQSQQATKLRAVQHLLRSLPWKGRVRAFGDGPNDLEMLTWLDGAWVHPERPAPPWLRRGEVSDDR